jgi:transcription initiation factor TFIID subunit 10
MDPQLAWLLALVTQKFITDIATGAYQYSQNRASNTSSNNPMGNLGAATIKSQLKYQFHQIQDLEIGKRQPEKDLQDGFKFSQSEYHSLERRINDSQVKYDTAVLTMEDLGMAVGEYGVNVKWGGFYR